MKTIISKTLLCISVLMSAFSARPIDLKYLDYYVCMPDNMVVQYYYYFDDNKSICYPIDHVTFTFEGRIEQINESDGIICTMYSDDEPVATGILSAQEYSYALWPPISEAIVKFDEPLTLPKGKSYKLVVPSGVIYERGNPDIAYNDLCAEFEVPSHISKFVPTVSENSGVKKVRQLGFDFRQDISSVAWAKVVLYRKDVPLREYPVNVWGDSKPWCAGIDFGKGMSFEKDVEYTVSIPKETIYAMHRLDICNEELSFSFTGGGGDLQKPLIFYSSSLNEFRKNFKNNGVCGELRLYYKLPVELSLTPVIQLTEDGVVIKEVSPILTQEEDRWILTADFENTPVNSEKKYSVILPEGTLVMQEGITVNQRKEFFIGDTTSISEIEAGGFAVSVDNGVVTVDGIAGEGDVRLYTLDGKQIFSGVAAGGTVSISVSAAGVCILSVDGKTQKITVK